MRYLRPTKNIGLFLFIAVFSISAHAGGIGGAFSNAAKSLNASQLDNVARFYPPASNATNITYHRLPNDGVAVQSFSPANNSGYGKMYEKQIDSMGNTVNFNKTTYGPNGIVNSR